MNHRAQSEITLRGSNHLAISRAEDRAALWIVDGATGSEVKPSFSQLSKRSNQVANYLRAKGLKRGDHLLLLLGNVVPLWETMLAAISRRPLGSMPSVRTWCVSGSTLWMRVGSPVV